MTPIRHHLSFVAGLALTTALAFPASAQAQETTRQPQEPTVTRIFPLKNTTQAQDGIEVLNALRTLSDPHDRIFISQNTIVMQAPADHIANAEKILSELDKPKKAYRLTYTLIDLDGTKRVGDQHYSMVLVPGQRTVLKQGNKVPVYTGAYVDKTSTTNQQVTYLDVGMDFEATLDDSPNSLRLRTKVSQSSVIEDHMTVAALQDPVLRQSVFEGSAILTPGKPLIIGTLDIAGTTRRAEIQVTAEPLAQ